MKIEVPSASTLTVTTQAASDKELKRHQQVIEGTLRALFPAYKDGDIKTVDLDHQFLEPGIADKVKTIIDRRLYSMSEIREPLIQKQGEDRIIVELPGVRDPDRVLRILKSTAMLQFLIIPARYETAGEDQYDEWRDKTSGQTVPGSGLRARPRRRPRRSSRAATSRATPKWDRVKRATGSCTSNTTDKKQREFYNFTRKNVGRLMAIVLDDKCQMAPVIKDALPGRESSRGPSRRSRRATSSSC